MSPEQSFRLRHPECLELKVWIHSQIPGMQSRKQRTNGGGVVCVGVWEPSLDEIEFRDEFREDGSFQMCEVLNGWINGSPEEGHGFLSGIQGKRRGLILNLRRTLPNHAPPPPPPLRDSSEMYSPSKPAGDVQIPSVHLERNPNHVSTSRTILEERTLSVHRQTEGPHCPESFLFPFSFLFSRDIRNHQGLRKHRNPEFEIPHRRILDIKAPKHLSISPWSTHSRPSSSSPSSCPVLSACSLGTSNHLF